ncbi:GDSL esterase/lipase At5g22810 [Beta vulgaris subsp. vulgaris]|uniref:GDSL esterase/lipase At5g22810 n=1 Tax=Beta vulgaris subsp. vulgaris TaxID=3555 RepID=UPI0020366EC3|nr:GDSL esterase/lipase At5g22810 [Beta vulgaris subsp. vulgaris]
MGILSNFGSYIYLVIFLLVSIGVNGQPIVPALFIFGDSVVDVGNNNNLHTIVKSDFLPYGRDFSYHQPTGRFCNGKLATDFTAETIGFTSYQPAYLSTEATGENLLIGANFASASSGYHASTPKIYNTIPLSEQLEHYMDYQKKLELVAGQDNATLIITQGIYLISAGSSDFLQNYYINPLLYKLYSPEEFSHVLVQQFADLVRKLYWLGARKVGVTSLPPLGCLPAAITIFGEDSNDCVDHINKDAMTFNDMLNSTSEELQSQLSNLTLVVFDIYQPLYQLVTKPEDNGFVEARKACCGTGVVETSYLCNSKSPGTCSNASEYVFWDGFHPSEATNRILSDDLTAAAISLIS